MLSRDTEPCSWGHAVPFDLATGAISGSAVPVVDGRALSGVGCRVFRHSRERYARIRICNHRSAECLALGLG